MKVSIFCVALVIIPLCLSAEVLHIPDANLERVLREALNVPAGTPIMEADMRQLTALNAAARQITNLTGLEHATNLTELRLGENPIADIGPLAHLTQLSRLRLNDCWTIDDISPLEHLTQLNWLDLDRNLIVDIGPLAGLTQLTSFDIRYNRVEDLGPLENLTQLTGLFLDNNKIKDVRPLANLTQLTQLFLNSNKIVDISPLVNLTQLTQLRLDNNKIKDVRPLANLTQLTQLFLNSNKIVDISPLVNLTQLTQLRLDNNQIVDVSPLVNLTQLIQLWLDNNKIKDVRSLASLTRLEILHIRWNSITDHSPLDGLSLTDFLYDQTCDMPPLPLAPRIKNRTYPSIFARWGPSAPARHDLWFDVLPRELYFRETSHGVVIGGLVDRVMSRREEYLAVNPTMVYLVQVRMRSSGGKSNRGYLPEDSPYWIRDSEGNIVEGDLIDFTHPYIQDRIVKEAIAISKCGLFDGIFFDYWHEGIPVLGGFRTMEAEQRARDNILQRIRANTRPNFLIMGNTNDRIIPRTAPHINGGFMETGIPEYKTSDDLEEVENSLMWLEHNLREPRINALEGFSLPSEPLDSPNNLMWMRALTALSLTHSDGYVLYTESFFSENPTGNIWYDFWDADLGQPVSAKGQLYQETEGLYIRNLRMVGRCTIIAVQNKPLRSPNWPAVSPAVWREQCIRCPTLTGRCICE